ncbi:ATP-grasp domain-containing protein [Streptomyces sp. NBC_00444]|uniref:ATP-grasp domain-containing protein n=1 Tax=Streptomyces sp. NBC_00444 TaxID=2975744 RepID=UPI002E1B935E
MNILILHSLSDSFVDYAHNIDHFQHDVVYVGTPERLATMPRDVPASRIERAAVGDPAAAVLAAVAGLAKPDIVIGLSELDIIPAAQVREALGVPGATVHDVVPVRDKVVMKSAVAEAGIRIPRFAALGEALRRPAPGLWTGRTVLKPLAGASSKWTYTYPTLAAALEAVRQQQLPAPADEFEVEEFIDGPIMHVDGLLADGRPLAVQASRYVGNCLDYAEGSALGSVQVDTTTELTEWTIRCLAAVGIRNGPFHLEAFETADGPVFLEVGARCGSRGTVDAFELAHGIRLPGAAVRLLVDGPAAIQGARTPEPDECYGWFTFPGHLLGSRYCRITGEEVFRGDPLVRYWDQRRPDEPIKHAVSYSYANVPIGGLLGPAPTTALLNYLRRLFQEVRVVPHGPAVRSREPLDPTPPVEGPRTHVSRSPR